MKLILRYYITKTKTRFLTVGLAVIVLLAAALFVIPALGTTADAAWNGTTIAGTFAGGKGTQDDPYQIANGEQLAYLAQQVNNDALSGDEYFVLTDDIDLGGKDWTPIGSDDYDFGGIFNGNGYTISNLKPTVYNGYTGLFGSNSGTIRNVYLDGVDVVYTEGYGAAALCAKNGTWGTIEGCAVLGGRIDASSTDASGVAAGICAVNSGKINKCYNMAAVTTNTIGAGIVYANGSDGTVSNCYNAGEVSGTSTYRGTIGGICSENYGKIEYCLNYGDVKNAKTAGSICALNYYGESTSTSEDSTINSCYSDSNACSAEPIGYAGGGRESDVGKKTTAELCGTIPSGFDSTIWSDGSKTAKVDENNARKHTVTYTYPSLTGVGSAYSVEVKEYNFSTGASPDWQPYTEIGTAEEYNDITKIYNDVNGNYVLTGNIVFGGNKIDPIGAFKGKFSGDGFTISNFTINENAVAGLFDYNYGLIMNLAVNGDISGAVNVGGISGANNGTISNCYAICAIEATGNYAAGISGDVTAASTIENCYFSGTISTGGYSGVKIGAVCAKEYGNVENCYYNKDLYTADDTRGTGKTSAELCDKDSFNSLNLDKSIWQAGGITRTTDAENKRMSVVNAKSPSLIGVGEPLSLGEEKQYNFKTNGDNDDWQEYTEINLADDLAKINDNLSGSYVLMNDITLGDFSPIGSQDAPFTGKFSGNGHKITVKNAGIFGYNKGTIMNLAVEGNISGGTYVGSICGYNNGTIYACSFNGSVKGAEYVGGICGYNSSTGTISNCYAIGSVEATVDHAGGICGRNDGGMKINRCYFAGTSVAPNDYNAICSGASPNCYYDRELLISIITPATP